MSKERTIDEYRQVKGFGYVAPHSHDKRLLKRECVSFTRDELQDFTKGLLDKLGWLDDSIIDGDPIRNYIEEYFD